MTVYGGVNIDDQTRALRRGVDFFVGTCGRVLDHIERGNIDFSALKTVILDEADQMLKQGFKEEVDKVSIYTLFAMFIVSLLLSSLDSGLMQTSVRS